MKNTKHFFESLSEAWKDIWGKKTQENASVDFYFSESNRSSFRFVLMAVALILGLVIVDLAGYFIFGKEGGHNYIFTIPAFITLLAIPAYFLAKLIAYHTHWFPKVVDRTTFAIIAWIVLTVLLTVVTSFI